MEEKNTVELKLPAFVLEGSVLLPGAVARLETDPSGLALVKSLSRSEDKRVIVALSVESELGVHPIAALARVEGVGRDGGVIVAATGRVRVLDLEDGEGKVPMARVEEIPAQFIQQEHGVPVLHLLGQAVRIFDRLMNGGAASPGIAGWRKESKRLCRTALSRASSPRRPCTRSQRSVPSSRRSAS